MATGNCRCLCALNAHCGKYSLKGISLKGKKKKTEPPSKVFMTSDIIQRGEKNVNAENRTQKPSLLLKYRRLDSHIKIYMQMIYEKLRLIFEFAKSYFL